MFENLLVSRKNPVVLPSDLAAFGRFDLPPQYGTSSPPVVTPEWTLLQTFIDSATDAVSQLAAVSLCQEKWLWTLDFFPGTADPRQLYNYQLSWAWNWLPFWWAGFATTDAIEFIRRPVMIGGSPPLDPVVTYDDPFGNPQILDPTLYTVRCDKLVLIPGNWWPPTSRLADCIRIEYNAGFSADNSIVPPRLKTAILFLANWWQENRLLAGTEPTKEVMFTLNSLIQPFKMVRIPR